MCVRFLILVGSPFSVVKFQSKVCGGSPKNFTNKLPFKLTNAQQKVLNDKVKDKMNIVFNELHDQQVEIVVSEKDQIKKQLKEQLKEQTAEIIKLYSEEIEKYKKIEQKVKKQDEQEKYEKIRHLCHLIDDYKLYKQLKKDNVKDIAIFFTAKYNYFENSDDQFKEKLDDNVSEKFENCTFESINTELINMALEYYKEMKQIKIEIDHSYKELEID